MSRASISLPWSSLVSSLDSVFLRCHISALFTASIGRGSRSLQLLVHSITCSKSMWTGFGYSDMYDWPSYAMAMHLR